MTLVQKIMDRTAVVGVIGLGYVGLPLAVLNAKHGFRVFGIDDVMDKVERVNRGESYISDVEGEQLQHVVEAGYLTATTDCKVLNTCDVVLICVPTPLTKNKEPDISAVLKATREISGRLHPGMLVILESTTYPGTTEEIVVPILRESRLVVGEDLFVAFSPERVDPGNRSFKTHNTYKLVGGMTGNCTAVAQRFYEQTIEKLFPVSSPRVAELTKVFENVFRSVNIALVNELALLCDRMHVNVYEVIDAAATKNFGFMPFYPGPGVGGHCIPLDPYYLAWKSKEYDLPTRLIELAGEINESMPYYVVNKLQRVLNQRRRCLNGAQIFVLGVTYKADTEDPRVSPAIKVMELLQRDGAALSYADPFTPTLAIEGRPYKSQSLAADLLGRIDCALILTAHSAFDYELIVRHAPLVFDTRNGTRSVSCEKSNVVLL